MAQIVALVMIAQASTGAITSVKVGEFLSMGACRRAAEHAVSIGDDAATHVSFECVPLSPVSDNANRR